MGDEKIDGVLITNPTSEHVKTAIKLSHLGVPLFIEKPLDSIMIDTEKLQHICRDAEIQVLMGYNLLYHPAITKVKKLLQDNTIGKVVSCRAQFGSYMPDWHPDEDYKKSYTSLKSLGGGVTLTSIHELNYITELFGDVSEIHALEINNNLLDIDAEEGVEMLMLHQNGIVSNIHLNFFQIPNRRYLEVIGSMGTIYWDFWKPFVYVKMKKVESKHILGRDAYGLLDISYRNQMEHFINICKGNEESQIPLSKGIKDLIIANAVLEQIKRV